VANDKRGTLHMSKDTKTSGYSSYYKEKLNDAINSGKKNIYLYNEPVDNIDKYENDF